MGGCGGLERTDFEQFLLWKGGGLEELGVVVWKELILNSFYFGRACRCGGLERTDFEQFLLWEDRCGGLERTDFEQFLLWEGCEWGFQCRCGGLEKTDFRQFLGLWES